MNDTPTLRMNATDRVLWAMWNGKLQAEGLGMWTGRNGKAETVPYDDTVHAPVSCRHGVASYCCGICTGHDNYRSIPAILRAISERRAC